MTVLARDAAEILFEMAAMQDKSPEAHDMLEKSQQIEVRCMASLQRTAITVCNPTFDWAELDSFLAGKPILEYCTGASRRFTAALTPCGMVGFCPVRHKQACMTGSVAKDDLGSPRWGQLSQALCHAWTRLNSGLKHALTTGSITRDDWGLQRRR